MDSTQQLQDTADAPVDPIKYKRHFSRVPEKKRGQNHIKGFGHINGEQKWSLSYALMRDLDQTSRITENALNTLQNPLPKVTVNHVPAPDAGLLCWYVQTIITQAAKHSVWSFPSVF